MPSHYKYIPAERRRCSQVLVKQKTYDLFHNQPFINSLDQIYHLSGPKAAEQIMLKAMDDLNYEEISPARQFWSKK